MTDKTLFDRLGGKAAVTAVVDKMYDKILSDPVLQPFFKDIDMARLRRSQTAFVVMAFGGPHAYTGEALKKAHAPSVRNGLSAQHFEAVAGHLVSAMKELNVPQDLINESIAIVAATRSDVLAGS